MLYKLLDKASVTGKYICVWLEVTSNCVGCSVYKVLVILDQWQIMDSN